MRLLCGALRLPATEEWTDGAVQGRAQRRRAALTQRDGACYCAPISVSDSILTEDESQPI